jgi:hypothetical protein
VLVLFASLVCPLAEMFDHWDHTLQTGNDTEYALVLVAMCVGCAYSFARLIFRLFLRPFASGDLFSLFTCKPFHSIPIGSLPVIPIPISPSALELRI